MAEARAAAGVAEAASVAADSPVAASAAAEEEGGRGIVLPIDEPKAKSEAWKFLYAVHPRLASASEARAAVHEPFNYSKLLKA